MSPSLPSRFLRSAALFAVCLFSFSTSPLAAELTLRAERGAADDLEIVIGEKRGFLTRDDLQSLPRETIETDFEVIGSERSLEVVDLATLTAALKIEAAFAIVTAHCTDGYWSVYEPETFERHRPYLVIGLDGRPLSEFTAAQGRPDWGPYWVSVRDAKEVRDAEHWRPWGVLRLEWWSDQALFQPLRRHVGQDPAVETGMKLFIGNCASCHALDRFQGGGSVSNRTATILSVHARFNEAYFLAMLADPVGTNPTATLMPATTDYSEEELQALLAFLRAYGQE